MGKEESQSCLIAIRSRQLGDVLATLDALRVLKEARPSRSIAFVVDRRFHGLLAGETYIDTLMESPPEITGVSTLRAYIRYVRRLRALRPSVVLDFHSTARTALLAVLSGAAVRVGFDVRGRKLAYTNVVPRVDASDGRAVARTSAVSALRLAQSADTGVSAEVSLPRISVGATALARGSEALRGCGLPADAVAERSIVGLNPGRAYAAKAWPEAFFVELASGLVKLGRKVAVMWGPGEEEAGRRILESSGEGVHMILCTELIDMPGVMAHLSLLVTIDSGLKHMAVCAGVPTLTLFGPTSPAEWHMGTDRDRYLWRGYSCSPCRRIDCPFGAPCMADISPGEVLAEVERMLTKG